MRCGWLFDETINMYMWLLQQRNNAWVAQDPQNRKPTYFYSSFFFEKVFEKKKNGKKIDDSYNYSSVKRWARKVYTRLRVFLEGNNRFR
jgi:Ulp1 family protease